ncbi:MAG: hypothetical protein ACTHJQ_27315 [Rhizobiaceae bacterium]|jgi:hypothetical protein
MNSLLRNWREADPADRAALVTMVGWLVVSILVGLWLGSRNRSA